MQFFFKATLLQQVDDLLKGIQKQLNDANALVDHLEESLRPILKEIDELQEKIKSMEFVEEMTQQAQSLKKKLAWSWVYDTERKLDEHQKFIEKLKTRIPSCQAMIDKHHVCCSIRPPCIFIIFLFLVCVSATLYENCPNGQESCKIGFCSQTTQILRDICWLKFPLPIVIKKTLMGAGGNEGKFNLVLELHQSKNCYWQEQ